MTLCCPGEAGIQKEKGYHPFLKKGSCKMILATFESVVAGKVFIMEDGEIITKKEMGARIGSMTDREIIDRILCLEREEEARDG